MNVIDETNAATGELIVPAEASKMTGLSEARLATMRCSGEGPPFYKVGAKYVRYDTREVMAWMRSKRRTSTSQVDAA